jgi:hypothetical protein
MDTSVGLLVEIAYATICGQRRFPIDNKKDTCDPINASLIHLLAPFVGVVFENPAK